MDNAVESTIKLLQQDEKEILTRLDKRLQKILEDEGGYYQVAEGFSEAIIEIKKLFAERYHKLRNGKI